MPHVLPSRFQEMHDIGFFFHDAMLSSIIQFEEFGLFETNLQFDDDDVSDKFGEVPLENILDFLEEHGQREDSKKIVVRSVVRHLVSDFLHFIYESLDASMRGKLTVAFALLRKPLKENLFYLEMILSDEDGFFRRFASNDPAQLNISDARHFPPEFRVGTVARAVEKIEYSSVVDSDFIYMMRFDKQSQFSLEPVWQHANHLITTYRSLATAPRNFNFIFSQEEEIESQWEHYYRTVPLLLFYAFSVVDAVCAGFAEKAPEVPDYLPLKVYAAYVIWWLQSDWFDIYEIDRTEQEKFLCSIAVPCGECREDIIVTLDRFYSIYLRDEIECSNCALRVNLLDDVDQE